MLSNEWAGEGEGQWKAEASFAHQMGFGGKVDLHVPGDAVIDFKTKEFDAPPQTSRLGTSITCSSPPTVMAWASKSPLRHRLRQHNGSGSCQADRDSRGRLQRGWTCFYSLLHFWQAKSSYRSAFSLEAAAA
jgi:hypothetical protein